MPKLRSVLVVAVTLLAACGSSGTKATPSEPTNAAVTAQTETTSSRAPETVPVTDPASTGGTVDDLAAIPLPDKTSLTIAVAGPIEGFAPLYVARELGEFGKENLNVDIKVMPVPDALQLLAVGDIDIAITSTSATTLNAINDLGIRLVAPYKLPSTTGEGLYIRNDLAQKGPAAMKGETMLLTVGLGTPVDLPLSLYLAEGGLTLDDVAFQALPAADQPTALRNGAGGAAWLNAPIYLEAASGDFATRVAGFPANFIAGYYAFGKNLLKNRLAGEAFVRAIARTNRDYLQGDYHQDPAVMNVLAQWTGVPVDKLKEGTPGIFDPRLTMDPVGVEDLQQTWLERDLLSFTTPLTLDQIFDRKFAADCCSLSTEP